MAHSTHGAQRSAAPILEQGKGKLPPSELRDALQMIHVGLLFNERFGMDVNSVLSSIREELDVSPRLALAEAMRMGLVEEDPEFPEGAFIRRGPRSGEALRRIYDGKPPTRESIMSEARAWQKYFDARDARLAALREAARPREENTASSLPAWVP